MSGIVEATCRKYGVKYTTHESFRAGLASHYRWLRHMGKGREPDPNFPSGTYAQAQ